MATLVEGEPLTLVAQKLRAGFGKFGLRRIGEIGEPFDPSFHEAIVQIPTPGATRQTVADVITPGYALFDRLIRAAKVAVSVPSPDGGRDMASQDWFDKDFYGRSRRREGRLRSRPEEDVPQAGA